MKSGKAQNDPMINNFTLQIGTTESSNGVYHVLFYTHKAAIKSTNIIKKEHTQHKENIKRKHVKTTDLMKFDES